MWVKQASPDRSKAALGSAASNQRVSSIEGRIQSNWLCSAHSFSPGIPGKVGSLCLIEVISLGRKYKRWRRGGGEEGSF